MKLELKHLSGYLPYGLKCRTDIGDLHLTCLTTYDRYKAWFHYKVNSKDKLVEYNLKNNTSIDNSCGKGFKLGEIKPILRPLSDLTKEIEVNGEKFVPIENLTKMFDLNENYELRFENNLFVLWNKKYEWYRINDNNFILFQKLFEWHFDIYGLIKKGLAININAL